MKIELKHLAPYLPYGLKMKFTSTHEVDKLSNEDIVILKQIDEVGICVNGYKTNNKSYKPILRPLSDLTKEIEVNGEKFVPIEKYNYLRFEEISNYNGGQNVLNFIQVREHNLLLEMHFDVFGLIPQGLAIDINTIENR